MVRLAHDDSGEWVTRLMCWLLSLFGLGLNERASRDAVGPVLCPALLPRICSAHAPGPGVRDISRTPQREGTHVRPERGTNICRGANNVQIKGPAASKF